MVDAALIKECSDPGLKPAVVEQFIERAGSQDPLAVTVLSGNRVMLVPKPTTADEAMNLIGQHVGRNVVRVGVTQYPAGLGVVEAGELKSDLVDTCANLRTGTALFAKLYRIVTKWYGNPTDKDVLPQVFDDAIIAWQTGYFEGTAVFTAQDPGGVKLESPVQTPDLGEPEEKMPLPGNERAGREGSDHPNKAGIRVDLSSIRAQEP
ncbi:TraH family protein [Corticibacterium sp. UT-5YL-CI-8]|nr:TraH family protein [Tianweitania sp. UT-5YL-CI-8]